MKRTSRDDDAMMRTKRMTVAQLKKHMDRRFATTDRRIARLTKDVNTRFATRVQLAQLKRHMDARFAAQERSNNQRFAAHDRRFDVLEAKMDAMMKYMREHLGHLTAVVDNHEHRLQDLERPHAN